MKHSDDVKLDVLFVLEAEHCSLRLNEPARLAAGNIFLMSARPPRGYCLLSVFLSLTSLMETSSSPRRRPLTQLRTGTTEFIWFIFRLFWYGDVSAVCIMTLSLVLNLMEWTLHGCKPTTRLVLGGDLSIPIPHYGHGAPHMEKLRYGIDHIQSKHRLYCRNRHMRVIVVCFTGA